MQAGGRYLDAELAADAMAAGGNPLTVREREIMRLIGAETADIARRLHLSDGTVRNYLSSAMAKLGESNRLAAVRTATEMGWL